MAKEPSSPLEVANTLVRNGRYAEAESLYVPVIHSSPTNAAALRALAELLTHQYKHKQALPWLERLVALTPDDADAHFKLGLTLSALRRFDDAVLSFQTVLKLDPQHAQSYYQVGVCKLEQGRLDRAIRYLVTAIRFKPDFAEAYSSMGAISAVLNRPQDAAEAFEKAVALKPDFAIGHASLGMAYASLNQHEAAIGAFSKALLIKPELAAAQRHRGLSHLALGQFRQGWHDHEARWKLRELPIPGPAGIPIWQGESDINGKSLLLLPEQSLGDTIQCLRFVPQLTAMGARCIVQVQPALQSIAERSLPMAKILHPGESAHDVGFRLPYLSIPHALDIATAAEINSPTPYLLPDVAKASAFQRRFRARHERVVAFAWKPEAPHQADPNRSLALAELVPLFASRPWLFVSMQRDASAAERALLAQHDNVLALGDELRNCDDNAAVIAAADQVVSVDCSIAHMAGALGKPVSILLAFSADWRWLLDREDSPWYPSARLLRQPAIGDWTTVVRTLLERLSA